MEKSAALSEQEIDYLEKVFNGAFINLASASKDLEVMVLKGYVARKALALMPMMPTTYSYELTGYGLILLREYRTQYL
jgi:hypothetical protein